MCFGSFLQTDANVPAIETQATVDAVNFMAEVWKKRAGQPRLLLERRVEQPVPPLG